MDEELFSFEKLEVYHKAIDFIDSIFSTCDKFPNKIQYSLGDHLRKTSLSIANNIAEGSDKRFPKTKKQFYEYSLDSARECIPMLTVSLRQNLISKSFYGNLRSNCTAICKMLRRLIQSVK